MKDSYGRDINYLRVSVTDRCNLRCRYCMDEKGIQLKQHHEIMSYEEMLQVITCGVELGIKKVRITGGEPLVRKDILSFLSQVSQIEGLEELCLTTNGVLLKSMAHELKQAGVNRINISLDTLDKEKYQEITRGGNLDDVIEGIKEALSLFEKIKLNVVVMKGFNDLEINDFMQLTLNYPLDVRFIELMPIGVARTLKQHYESLQNLIDSRSDLISLHKNDGPSLLYRLPHSLGTIGLIQPMSHSFCSSCNRLRLTADGKIKACLFASQEVDVHHKTKAEVKRILQEVILNKPKSKMEEPMTSRKMNEIGG